MSKSISKKIIAIILIFALIFTTIYFYTNRHQTEAAPKKTVEVVPVSNINVADWVGEYDNSSGEIVSLSKEFIPFDKNKELDEILVEEGDTVKKGDVLFRYNMEKQEVEALLNQLTAQSLKIDFDIESKTLAKMKGVGYESTLDYDSLLKPMVINSFLVLLSAESDILIEDEMPSEENNTGDVFEENPVNSEPPVEDNWNEIPEEQPEIIDENNEEIIDPNQIDDGMIEENNPEENIEEDAIQEETIDDTILETELIVEDEHEYTINTDEAIKYITEFMTRLNQVSEKAKDGIEYILKSDLEEALKIYHEKLCEKNEVETTNSLYETEPFTYYNLHPDIMYLLDEDQYMALTNGYQRALIYQLSYYIYEFTGMKTPNDESMAIEKINNMTDEEIKASYNLLKDTLAIINYMDNSLFEEETYKDYLVSYENVLKVWIDRYNFNSIIETPETELQSETEMEPMTGFELPDSDFDYDSGLGDYDVAQTYTKEEIDSQEYKVKDIGLKIKEAEIKINQDNRVLEHKEETASIDGIIKSIGNDDSSEKGITIEGDNVRYIKGALSESTLSYVHVGDSISAYSYDTGERFTATITEINDYPSEQESYYSFGDSSDESSYGFMARIDDENDNLREGGFVDITFEKEKSDIYLEDYMIRYEDSGRSYVMIDDGNGTLKKQYVKTGSSESGYGTEILAGLSEFDYIAFPYGANAVEGTATEVVDALEEMNDM